MAFELITGHAGRNHVDSADMGEAFAGIVGKGRYILDTGDGMACSMTDSNTLTVGTGSMLMDGRIVRNETAATFRIANGTQGQYRHDLACLRYTLDRSNDSIESVEQVVLQGTPATTASEAKDPEYEAGDILSGDLSATVPIARVKLDNLTPTCEAMLDSVTSLKSLGDSVSLSEWTYLYGSGESGKSFVRYRRDGARCVLHWNATQGTSAYWVVGRLPDQMRPRDGNVYVPGVCVSPDGFVENVCAYCYISASTGEVGLQVATTTNRNIRNCGETSWFI